MELPPPSCSSFSLGLADADVSVTVSVQIFRQQILLQRPEIYKQVQIQYIDCSVVIQVRHITDRI